MHLIILVNANFINLCQVSSFFPLPYFIIHFCVSGLKTNIIPFTNLLIINKHFKYKFRSFFTQKTKKQMHRLLANSTKIFRAQRSLHQTRSFAAGKELMFGTEVFFRQCLFGVFSLFLHLRLLVIYFLILNLFSKNNFN